MRPIEPPPPETIGRTIIRVLLGVFMTVAGVGHLTLAREDFRAQVPAWVPVPEDLVVVGSGIVEIALGLALLLLPRQRRVVGLALAAFYVVIFPGNIAQWVEGVDAFGLDTDAKRFARLFFQPLLVAAALYAAGSFGRTGRGLSPRGEPGTRSAPD